ncbi:single-stranded-DNA-specific exonuclease RecJ [Paenibacillus sp. IB182496]|uniref:Single-stranded-DNA-specific exonuclease RecJ n=1 Tax=Paenibacillus sabuli TaxID=2772509 RepID=A0A927BPY4_9BACL|nr:single-stranded-DNA-specific exonuclease RecJ [Paenibacillus sabuli]MBD2844572.1 single-stranded-DNA-specific exonuclease RecJ [Paenibacillus sabuli]
MIEARTTWRLEPLTEAQQQQCDELTKLPLPRLVAELLVRRGISDAAAARVFLYGEGEAPHDPLLLAGMEQAVRRIRRAVDTGERVRIYGDYDADGVSSTALMIRLFAELGLDYDYYIPHRQLEGYGLNAAAIEKAAERGVTLIVTVDTGISAVEQIALARARGVDVVVTDHHEPPQVLPEACAIVNPKLPHCGYPFKGLAGAGVAFKLAHALLGRPPLEWADLAALGTVADLMPLVGENRWLVRQGLQRMQASANSGLRALAEVAGVRLPELTSTNVAFALAPRINASGRLAHADEAVSLLVGDDPEEAIAAATRLDELNKQRQRMVADMTEEAAELWQQRLEACSAAGEAAPAAIVVTAPHWNVGVVGIVASKLVERFYRPTVVLALNEATGLCKGSARSIEGFDLYAGLQSCAELFEHYGGHQAAAGMTLSREGVPELERRLGAAALAQLRPEQWQPTTQVDAVCTLEEANLRTITEMAALEPFGAGNPAPRIWLRGACVEESRAIGKSGAHLKLTLGGGGRRLEALRFGAGELARQLAPGVAAEFVGELAVNEWNGTRRPQLLVNDLSVREIQIFDWRGDAAGLERWLQDAAPGRVIAAVGAPEPRQDIAAAAVRGAGGPAVERLAYADLPERLRCTDLLLVGRPPSAARLAELLQRCPQLERIAALYPSGRSDRAGFPERSHFIAVYQQLRSGDWQRCAPETAAIRLAERTGWSTGIVRMMLDVFAELGFLTLSAQGIEVAAAPRKRDLGESPLYQAAQRRHADDRLLHASTAELREWMAGQLSPRAGTDVTDNRAKELLNR